PCCASAACTFLACPGGSCEALRSSCSAFFAACSSFLVGVVVRATSAVGGFGVAWAGGVVAGVVEGTVETGGDGGGPGGGGGDGRGEGGVGCPPVDGGWVVTGGADGCGAGVVDGGSCTGDGCSIAGVRGSDEAESALLAGPARALVAVIRPTGSAVDRCVIA